MQNGRAATYSKEFSGNLSPGELLLRNSQLDAFSRSCQKSGKDYAYIRNDKDETKKISRAGFFQVQKTLLSESDQRQCRGHSPPNGV